MAAIDLDGNGILDGIVVGSFDAYGTKKWSFTKAIEISWIRMHAVDLNSDEKLSEVVFSLGFPYAFDSKGTKIWQGPEGTFNPKSIAPIDLDGDGILDDVAIAGESKIYALDADGRKVVECHERSFCNGCS